MESSVLDHLFDLKIGSFVRMIGWKKPEPVKEDDAHKLILSGRDSRYWDKMQVIERTLQECPGGVQIHYTCRPITERGAFSKDLYRFNTIEIEEVETIETPE